MINIIIKVYGNDVDLRGPKKKFTKRKIISIYIII